MLDRGDREEGDIPMAGMADIAFLLLVFFLVVTTINVDTGIGMTLPPPLDPEQDPPPIQDRNMLTILVNNNGDILLEDEPANLGMIRDEVVKHVTNNGEDPDYADSPDDAIVSLKTQEATPYRIYIDVLDEVRSGYNDVRDSRARQQFNEGYDELNEEQRKQIQEEIPLKISIAEPDVG
jgi:biopolymer transport protein ExbD